MAIEMQHSEPIVLDYSTYTTQVARWHSLKVNAAGNSLDGRSCCPYCAGELVIVGRNDDELLYSATDDREITRWASQCQDCGWWTVSRKFQMYDSGVEYGEDRAVYASIREFEIGDLATPLAALKRYLSKNPNSLNSLNKKKTEILVGDVLGEHLSCDVQHVGGVRDGGIDLFLVSADRQYLVQVKNRELGSKRWKAEPVTAVREFLGAIQLAGEVRGILVSTAADFTKPAREAANKAQSIGLLAQYDLINFGQFLEMMKVSTETLPQDWQQLLAGDIDQIR